MFVSDDEILAVLESYAAATPTGNDQQKLREWINKHPECKEQLIEFAASRDILKHSVEKDFESREERESFFALSRETFRKYMSSRAMPLVGIVARAGELELKKKDLEERLGISREILDFLEERRFEFASIPSAFVSRIADVLRTSADAVATYLKQDMMPAQAFHKNDGRPSKADLLDFASTVKKDFNLTDDQKNTLLGA